MSEDFDAAWSLLKEEDDDKPQFGENWTNTGYEGVKIPELTDGELLRLEGHPNERISYKATEELENRAMDRAVTTLATTGATPQEIAEFYEPQFQAHQDEQGPMYRYGNFGIEDFEDGVVDDTPESRKAYWESRAGDVEEAMPGQMFIDTPTHEQTYAHARKTAPSENAQRYGKRMKDFVTEMTTPMDLGFLGSDKTLDAPWKKTSNYRYEQASDMRPDSFSNPDYTPSAREVDRIARMPSEGGLGTRPAVGTATGFQDQWQTKLASEPFDAAWALLKALPEQQMFVEASPRTNASVDAYDEYEKYPMIDERGARSLGTVHPAIQSMLRRRRNPG